MARADVIALAQLLSAGTADTVALERYYDDAVRELALGTDHLTVISLVTGAAEQAVYAAPSTTARVLAVFYGQRELWPETYAGLASAVSPTWREVSGEPVAFTQLDTDRNVVRLFPTPTQPGAAYIPASGLFGASYPDYNVFFAHTEERSDVPAYLELYLACSILMREFLRDSAHQDMDFAQACGVTAQIAIEAVK